MSGFRIRTGLVATTLAAGVLTLPPGSAAQAAQTHAAAQARVAPAAGCSLSGYAPSRVAVGSKVTTKTFAPKLSDCPIAIWFITIAPYTGYLDHYLPSATQDDPTIPFPPKTFTNDDAGLHETGAFVAVLTPDNDGPQKTYSFRLVRRATWDKTVNAGPEPVKKGKKITITGTLKRVSWTWTTKHKMPYLGYAHQSVVLEFKAAGTATYKKVVTVKTGKGGKVTIKRTASKSGTWRLGYAGNSITGSAISPGDAVAVH